MYLHMCIHIVGTGRGRQIGDTQQTCDYKLLHGVSFTAFSTASIYRQYRMYIERGVLWSTGRLLRA